METPSSITAQAVAAFRDNTELSVETGTDQSLVFATELEEHTFSYHVEPTVTAPSAAHCEYEKNSLLVASYISGPAKQYLRERGINYLDAAGNAFLMHGQLLVHIETGKSVRPSPSQKGRAFTRAGLKVVFQLLTNSQAVNLPYREIAKLAGVSIDTVSKTVKDLLSTTYLIEEERGIYTLNREEKLVEQWVTFFNQVLRPKLRSAKFAIGKGSNMDQLAANCPANTLSGELAADLLGTELIAKRVTLYVEQPFRILAKSLNLVPAGQAGTVELVQQFWSKPSATDANRRTVHPLLIYADLLHLPTPRNLAAAAELYKAHVRPAIQRAT